MVTAVICLGQKFKTRSQCKYFGGFPNPLNMTFDPIHVLRVPSASFSFSKGQRSRSQTRGSHQGAPSESTESNLDPLSQGSCPEEGIGQRGAEPALDIPKNPTKRTLPYTPNAMGPRPPQTKSERKPRPELPHNWAPADNPKTKGEVTAQDPGALRAPFIQTPE